MAEDDRSIGITPVSVVVTLMLAMVVLVIGIWIDDTRERHWPWLLAPKPETCVALAAQQVAVAAGGDGQCTVQGRYQGSGQPPRTHLRLDLRLGGQWTSFDVLAEQVLSKRPL